MGSATGGVVYFDLRSRGMRGMGMPVYTQNIASLMRFLLAALRPFITATVVFGAPCEKEDFETRVSGESECLLMRRYGSIQPESMAVWIHGNVTSGGSGSQAHCADRQP